MGKFMARIFLTGAAGQLGREVELSLLQQGHVVISTNHRTLDITQSDKVMSAVCESNADVVINAAPIPMWKSQKMSLLWPSTSMP